MGHPSYMRSVVDRNVVMLLIHVLATDCQALRKRERRMGSALLRRCALSQHSCGRWWDSSALGTWPGCRQLKESFAHGFFF